MLAAECSSRPTNQYFHYFRAYDYQLYTNMLNQIFIAVFCLCLLAACGNNQATENAVEDAAVPTENVYADAVAALADGQSATEVSSLLMANFGKISDAQTGALNMAASKDFVKAAEDLSNKYNSDTAAAMVYYRSAEVARAMNDPLRAAEIYHNIGERYPDFSKAGEALFMLAFTYDEDLKDMEKAKATYEMFLEKYPDHTFADDTEMLLKNLGKTDEEILNALEQQ